MHYFLFEAHSYTTCQYEKASVVKGHHIYKAVWTPAISEEPHTKLEKDNEHDEHAVAVILDGSTVGQLLHTISLVSWFFLRLLPQLEALFKQCQTSTYEYLCGHVKRLPCLPYGHICGYPACIGDLAFIRGRLAFNRRNMVPQ